MVGRPMRRDRAGWAESEEREEGKKAERRGKIMRGVNMIRYY